MGMQIQHCQESEWISLVDRNVVVGHLDRGPKQRLGNDEVAYARQIEELVVGIEELSEE